MLMSTAGLRRLVIPAGSGSTAWTDICSSVIAPALLYYTPSMALCNICIHHIHVDYAGGRAPKVGALGDAGAVAGSRAMDAKLKSIHGAWIRFAL